MTAIDADRSDTDAFARVAQGFGNTAVRPIVQGLAAQLRAAIADLDADRFANSHRIAGLAGTLGFARVSRAWLAIDEGDLSNLPLARAEAVRAIEIIDRWLATTGSAPGSEA